jgi:hypothetical protein
MGHKMSWEIAIVAVVVAVAIAVAVRRYYKILTGKDKPCDSCPGTGPCPISTPEELEARLKKAMKQEKQEK